MEKIQETTVIFYSKEDIQYTGAVKYVLRPNYANIHVSNNSGNCKSAFVSNLGTAIAFKTDDQRKVIFDMLEKLFKVTLPKVIFTTTLVDKELVNIIKQRFPLVYCVKVPIGYGERNQYHCGFLTNNVNYSNYNRYKTRIDNDVVPKRAVISEAIKQKILSYKRKYYLEKYLDKLIG